jgi:hypothetical protein
MATISETSSDILTALFDAGGVAALEALVDTLIPPDDYPGGWEAGVGDYLARGFSGHLAVFVETYRKCLAVLDGEAAARHGKSFGQLASPERTALLEALDRGEAAAQWPIPPARFIQIAMQHAAEGFYADPANGGNKDAVAWKMVGFEVTA